MSKQKSSFKGNSIEAFFIRMMFNMYPPYLGAGVRVIRIGNNFDFIDAKLVLRFWNRNYVKTSFGGSMYSLCDPFLMYILIKKLGWDYVVWDKGAEIKFIKPGRTDLFVHFSIDENEIQAIKAQAAVAEKVEPVYNVEIKDKNGELVALVKKRMYIKKKPPKVSR